MSVKPPGLLLGLKKIEFLYQFHQLHPKYKAQGILKSILVVDFLPMEPSSYTCSISLFSAQTEVTITVEDQDDNLPTIIAGDYDASFSEIEPVGYTITTVYAEDPDVDFRDMVYFIIDSGNTDNRFRIVTDTATLGGLIQVNKVMHLKFWYVKYDKL